MISEQALRVIDETSADGSGWAQFSADYTQRFRLGRALSGRARDRVRHWNSCRRDVYGGIQYTEGAVASWRYDEELIRVVFVMLNPSTADAFKLDRTVARCVKFAALWGADVLEVVNLFALRSPYPEDLYAAAKACLDTGASMTNDDAIREVCTMRNVKHVVAAWGSHGALNARAEFVAELLRREGVKL